MRDPATWSNDVLVVTVIRLAKGGALESKASVGLKPLTEMTADDKYQGEDGSRYGAGKNQPPEPHLKIARAETAKIGPLDADWLANRSSLTNAGERRLVAHIFISWNPRISWLRDIEALQGAAKYRVQTGETPRKRRCSINWMNSLIAQ